MFENFFKKQPEKAEEPTEIRELFIAKMDPFLKRMDCIHAARKAEANKTYNESVDRSDKKCDEGHTALDKVRDNEVTQAGTSRKAVIDKSANDALRSVVDEMCRKFNTPTPPQQGGR